MQQFLSYSIRPTIHAVTLNLGAHSGITTLPFLLLYEVTLPGNSLQTFRENEVGIFQKVKMSQSVFPVENITKIVIDKFGKEIPSDEGV